MSEPRIKRIKRITQTNTPPVWWRGIREILEIRVIRGSDNGVAVVGNTDNQ